MRGLLIKTLHETWFSMLLLGTALMAVVAMLTYILPQIQEGMGDVFRQIPLAKPLLSALLGTELGSNFTDRMMQSFLWVHPTVLALTWAYVITFATRLPAGEIDRGTIDFLFSLPVSRRRVYYEEVIACLVSGMVILMMGVLGHRLAAPSMPVAMRPTFSEALLIITNLYCVYLAVAGISFLVSACSDRRGRAISVVFAVVLASFLITFIAQFWEPAQQAAFLSVMEYYQPALILQSGVLPASDVAVLLGVAGITLILGGEVMARRSICTV